MYRLYNEINKMAQPTIYYYRVTQSNNHLVLLPLWCLNEISGWVKLFKKHIRRNIRNEFDVRAAFTNVLQQIINVFEGIWWFWEGSLR